MKPTVSDAFSAFIFAINQENALAISVNGLAAVFLYTGWL